MKIKITTRPQQSVDEGVYVDPTDASFPEVITFFANCLALRLLQRGPKDRHICFHWMVEDDGHWSAMRGMVSSSWLPEVAALLEIADSWMKANAEPDIHNGHQFGYKLK